MRRRQEKTGAGPGAKLADVEREDFGQRPVEDGTKLVGHYEPTLARLSDREGEPDKAGQLLDSQGWTLP